MSITSDVTTANDLVLAGEVDVATSSELRSTLRSLIDEDPARTLTVDVSGVTFIDSTALGVLFGAHCRLQRRGGRISLVDPSPVIRRVLLATGLDENLLASRG
jgi:anti-sigma B factor antagonist